MPVSRRFTLSNGHRLSYMLSGEGLEQLVLVPGIMQSANRWRDAGYTDALEGGLRVIIPDPLGHGASAKSQDAADYETDRLMEHMLAVFDAANIERAALWGYSRGGILAGHFAAAHPDRVESLILGGSAAIIGLDPAASPPADAMAAALATGDWEQVFAVLRIDDEQTRANLRDGNDPVALSMAARGTSGVPAPDLSHLAGTRIFAYAGTEEPNYEAAKESAARLGFELAGIAGQGNAGSFQALDQVLPLVLTFLAQTR